MTSLVGGKRVPKTHLRIEAYGTIDELNAFIGLLMTKLGDPYSEEILRVIQDKLFALGAYLATDPERKDSRIERIENALEQEITTLEEAIDRIDGELPRMRNFVIPGGCLPTALAHVARTVCRRAERAILRLAEQEYVNGNVFIYMNRLSDLLFVIARQETRVANSEEILVSSLM
jgi:cob(I)alamin adenosyltransferase